MRADAPAFSVVIPCKDEVDTLAACLHALRTQDFPPGRFEVLVVDGGSTDGSRDLARRARVRLLTDGATGPGGARNVGIRAARAPIVAFTDADCVPARDWLTRHAEVFAEDPGLAGVGGAMRMSRESALGALEDLETRVHYRGLITSNVAYRRDVLLEVGGFAEDLRCAEDYDLAWRVMDAGHRVQFDPRPVVVHDPPELSNGLARYLRKQTWYARHDVPAHLRAMARARRDPAATASAGVALGLGAAMRDALWAGLAAGGLLMRSPTLVGAGLVGAGALATRRAWRTVERAGAPARAAPALAGFLAAKSLARGWGTLLGAADLARPRGRRLVRPPAAVSLAPSPPRAWPPRAETRA